MRRRSIRPSGCCGAATDGGHNSGAERGTAPGKNRVEIYWNRKTGKKIPTPGDPGVQMDATKQLLPDKYNAKSELTADLTTGSNTVNFDLPK